MFSPRPRPLWQRYLAITLYLLGAFILIQALAMVTTEFTGMATVKTEGKMPFRTLLYALVIQMTGFLLPAPLLLRFTRAGNFGFTRASSGDILIACGLTLLVIIAFSVLYSFFHVEPKQLAFLDPVELVKHRAAFIVMTAFIVPAYEEWIFRGVIFGILVTQIRRRLELHFAVFFTAMLFTLSHFEGRHSLSALPPIFAMALVFQYMTWRSHSIWPAVAAHAMQNLISASALIAKSAEQLSR